MIARFQCLMTSILYNIIYNTMEERTSEGSVNLCKQIAERRLDTGSIVPSNPPADARRDENY
jgi:hypothetical protein